MVKKIRLFVDAHVFDGIPQGSVTYLTGLYKELIKDKRFAIYIGSLDKEKTIRLLGSDDFIHIKYVTNSKLIRLLILIPFAIKQHKIEYAHFQYIIPIFKYCKYIVTIHDLLFLEYPELFPISYRIKNKWLFNYACRQSDIVATVSCYSKDAIHKFFRIPFNKIIVTPNAVIQSEELPELITGLEGQKFILYVSRIEPRKNQALLIEMWKDVTAKLNIDLVLVGEKGLNDKKFELQINALSNEQRKHFHWLSNVKINNLIWLYQNCTLFIFPSAAEGFGIPPLEAAYYGSKVICSNLTSMREFDFFEGFFFDPNNRMEMNKIIIESLSKEFPHDSVKNAIKQKYCWQNISYNFASKIVESGNK